MTMSKLLYQYHHHHHFTYFDNQYRITVKINIKNNNHINNSNSYDDNSDNPSLLHLLQFQSKALSLSSRWTRVAVVAVVGSS